MVFNLIHEDSSIIAGKLTDTPPYQFGLNCLNEGNYSDAMLHFEKLRMYGLANDKPCNLGSVFYDLAKLGNTLVIMSKNSKKITAVDEATRYFEALEVVCKHANSCPKSSFTSDFRKHYSCISDMLIGSIDLNADDMPENLGALLKEYSLN